MTTTHTPHRVLSGIRATGKLHLGNYLGAVKGMLELQDRQDLETLFMVADAHAVTTPYNPSELQRSRREVIIEYLAAGLNPEQSALFIQSDIVEHFMLSFLFASVTTIAKMQHLPTFKEKVKQYPDHATLALLNYPTLMAADILIYKADLVPVGIDQEPHLEVAREVARRMNQDYGTNFPEPQRFATSGQYIPSLTGEGKMSKTIPESFVALTDSTDEISRKVRAVPTATTAGGEMSGGVKTLFTLLELLAPENVSSFQRDYEAGTLRFVALKDAVTEAIATELAPFQERHSELSKDTSYVDGVIAEGAEKARAFARETLRETREKMGLL